MAESRSGNWVEIRVADTGSGIAEEVLRELAQIWRRPVRLETIRNGKAVRLGHDGSEATEENLEAITRGAA